MSNDPINVLDNIATDATEIWCLCDLIRDGKRSQIKLLARRNQKAVEALSCIPAGDDWIEEREDVGTIAEALRKLAERWGGEIDRESIQYGAKKSPVRGDKLETVFLAALFQAFHGEIPEDIRVAFEDIADKYQSGEAKPVTRKKSPKAKETPIVLPAAFDAAGESITFLARAKKRAAKDFKFTRLASLRATESLAFSLYVFDRFEEAEDVCGFIESYQFNGDFTQWGCVRETLALRHRLASSRGDKETADNCRQRILDVTADIGERMADTRDHSLENALIGFNEGNRVKERDWRMVQLGILETLLAVGGVKGVPIAKFKKEYAENLARLKELAGA